MSRASLEEIREWCGEGFENHATSYDYGIELFDEWLAEHDRQMRAEAWDEGADHCRAKTHANYQPKLVNPYRK